MLAIDLPGHGDRQNRGEELVPWTAVPDIQSAWNWAKGHWDKVALRATSIGVYFALACLDSPSQALLVSPILNMEQLILTMMDWAGVTEERLREQGKIATSFGQTLSWKYLCWVREHPVRDWKCPVCLHDHSSGGRCRIFYRKVVAPRESLLLYKLAQPPWDCFYAGFHDHRLSLHPIVPGWLDCPLPRRNLSQFPLLGRVLSPFRCKLSASKKGARGTE